MAQNIISFIFFETKWIELCKARSFPLDYFRLSFQSLYVCMQKKYMHYITTVDK